MTEIRVISLWQPWAALIALGFKQYETRSWSTPYRGAIAIHAAKRPVEYTEKTAIVAAISGTDIHTEIVKLFGAIDFPLGCIVAIANLTDCALMISHPSIAPLLSQYRITIDDQSSLERACGDWRSGRFAWKLENPIALPSPLPYRGGQGLRRIQDQSIVATLSGLLEAQNA